MRRHDERGLDLLLLALAAASSEPWNVARPASVWARAIGLSSPASKEYISKVWRRLEDLKLIERSKAGRMADITLLKEDGSGAPYEHPGSEGKREPYFVVPFGYWTAKDRWYRSLDLPAKAMLLIALSLDDDFILPYDKAPAWYGISADTAEKGLRRLRREALLKQRRDYKEAPLSPLGYTQQNYYELRAPFGPRGRGSRRAPRAAA